MSLLQVPCMLYLVSLLALNILIQSLWSGTFSHHENNLDDHFRYMIRAVLDISAYYIVSIDYDFEVQTL